MAAHSSRIWGFQNQIVRGSEPDRQIGPERTFGAVDIGPDFGSLWRPKLNMTDSSSSSDRRRGPGFSPEETQIFLDLLEERLPISMGEWETLADDHNQKYKTTRMPESLRKKFNKICRKRPPTGDPHIPHDVLQAKRIRIQLTQKSLIVKGEDAASFADTLMDDSESKEPDDVPGSDHLGIAAVDTTVAAATSSAPPTPQTRHRVNSKKKDDLADLVRLALEQAENDRKERAEERRQWHLDHEEERRQHQEFMQQMLVLFAQQTRAVQAPTPQVPQFPASTTTCGDDGNVPEATSIKK